MARSAGNFEISTYEMTETEGNGYFILINREEIYFGMTWKNTDKVSKYTDQIQTNFRGFF